MRAPKYNIVAWVLGGLLWFFQNLLIFISCLFFGTFLVLAASWAIIRSNPPFSTDPFSCYDWLILLFVLGLCALLISFFGLPLSLLTKPRIWCDSSLLSEYSFQIVSAFILDNFIFLLFTFSAGPL